jgi:hypothetical protein
MPQLRLLADSTRGYRSQAQEQMAMRIPIFVLSLIFSVSALAAEHPRTHLVDLRVPGALEQLHASDPAHYEKINHVLAGLAEEPKRAEGDWLKVNFNARDIDLSRHLIKTSNPPKQLLQFTLDDTRYILYVVRSDLSATTQPLEKPPTK